MRDGYPSSNPVHMRPPLLGTLLRCAYARCRLEQLSYVCTGKTKSMLVAEEIADGVTFTPYTDQPSEWKQQACARRKMCNVCTPLAEISSRRVCMKELTRLASFLHCQALEVLQGQFTCCQMTDNHKSGTVQCDRESLKPGVGVSH